MLTIAKKSIDDPPSFFLLALATVAALIALCKRRTDPLYADPRKQFPPRMGPARPQSTVGHGTSKKRHLSGPGH